MFDVRVAGYDDFASAETDCGAIPLLAYRIRTINFLELCKVHIIAEYGINSGQVWTVAVAGNLDSVGKARTQVIDKMDCVICVTATNQR